MTNPTDICAKPECGHPRQDHYYHCNGGAGRSWHLANVESCYHHAYLPEPIEEERRSGIASTGEAMKEPELCAFEGCDRSDNPQKHYPTEHVQTIYNGLLFCNVPNCHPFTPKESDPGPDELAECGRCGHYRRSHNRDCKAECECTIFTINESDPGTSNKGDSGDLDSWGDLAGHVVCSETSTGSEQPKRKHQTAYELADEEFGKTCLKCGNTDPLCDRCGWVWEGSKVDVITELGEENEQLRGRIASLESTLVQMSLLASAGMKGSEE